MTRFFEGYQWRFIFTDLDCVTTAFASANLTSNRKYTRMLGQPSVIECDVDPSDPRVHDLAADGYPRVAPSKRLLFGFRNEGSPLPASPWVCRAAGICMVVEDEGDPDIAVSHITAFDPRKLLDARPVQFMDGALPSPDGLLVLTEHGNQIVTDMLQATVVNDGGAFIDAGLAYGGTGFWAGTIESTPEIEFTFSRGTSVGDAWTQIESTGNCDIVLTPIYDPVNRPGYTHDLSIFNLAGSDRHNAVFGWDELNRALARIDRTHDGTPGSFFNKGQFFAGQAGILVPLLGPLENLASIADFGVYWQMQFFPSMTSTDPLGTSVYALLVQALQLAKQGKRTLTLNPTPERGPIPLDHYDIGDRVPVHASNNLRAVSDGLQRVESIPIDISDDGIETVAALLVTPDWVPPAPLPSQSQISTTTVSLQPQTGHRAVRPRTSLGPTR